MARIVTSAGTSSDFAAGAAGTANRDLLPSESGFIGKKGYWRKPAKVWRTGVGYVDGYRWGYRAPKKAKRGQISAHEAGEMMQDFNRAEDHRQRSLQSAIPKVAMKSQKGETHYVPEGLADMTARRNGWGRRSTFGYSRAFSEAWERVFGKRGE